MAALYRYIHMKRFLYVHIKLLLNVFFFISQL